MPIVDTSVGTGNIFDNESAIIRLPDGRIVVVWSDNSSGTYTVYIAILNKNGAMQQGPVAIVGTSGVINTTAGQLPSVLHSPLRPKQLIVYLFQGGPLYATKCLNLEALAVTANWVYLGEGTAGIEQIYSSNNVSGAIVDSRGAVYAASRVLDGTWFLQIRKHLNIPGAAWSSAVNVSSSGADVVDLNALCLDEDEYIHAVWGRRNGACYYARSVSPRDISLWRPEVQVGSGGGNALTLGIQARRKKVIIAYRDQTNNALKYNYSTDGGMSWAFGTTGSSSLDTIDVYQLNGIRMRGDGRIDFLYTDDVEDYLQLRFLDGSLLDAAPTILQAQTGAIATFSSSMDISPNVNHEVYPYCWRNVDATPDTLELNFLPDKVGVWQRCTAQRVNNRKNGRLNGRIMERAVYRD